MTALHPGPALTKEGKLPTTGLRAALSPTLSDGLMLGACLIVVGLLTWSSLQQVREKEVERFKARVTAIQNAIRDRLDRHAQVLKGAAGLFAASTSVQRDEWRAYFESLDLAERSRGFHALGYIERVEASNVDQFLSDTRGDGARHFDPSAFRISPPGSRPDYYVVKFVEPLVRNLSAVGYDLGSDPLRRQVADQARDRGEATLTHALRLVQAPHLPGVILLMPVFANDATPTNAVQRAAALVGWVYAAFIIEDLMGGILQSDKDDLDFEIFDGSEVSPETLMYRHQTLPDAVQQRGKPAFERTESFIVRHRTWTIYLSTGAAFEAATSYIVPQFIAVGGLCISLLLVGVIHSQLHTRHRAEAIAGQMTSELRASREELAASHEQLKAAHLQIIQAARLESVGTLAAGVAHEVKNPLQTMLMGLDYLQRNAAKLDANAQFAMGEMREAVNRANGIVRELLQISTVSKFERAPADLNAVIEQTLTLTRTDLNAKGIELVRHFEKTLPPVQIDRPKFEQVFINLFLNSIHAMPHHGKLTVSTRSAHLGNGAPINGASGGPLHAGDPVVIVEIQDTGEGIPPEYLPRIFDPFFTTKPTGSGTGLGLSVVKKIIDLHEGVITISNAPEGGARVTLVLRSETKAEP